MISRCSLGFPKVFLRRPTPAKPFLAFDEQPAYPPASPRSWRSVAVWFSVSAGPGFRSPGRRVNPATESGTNGPRGFRETCPPGSWREIRTDRPTSSDACHFPAGSGEIALPIPLGQRFRPAGIPFPHAPRYSARTAPSDPALILAKARLRIWRTRSRDRPIRVPMPSRDRLSPGPSP